MLQVRTLDDEDWHVVSNSVGQILIYTTSSSIAHFVNQYTPKLDPSLRLNVGGDPATRRRRGDTGGTPVFHHVRRYRR
jgi:hypothetical protein